VRVKSKPRGVIWGDFKKKTAGREWKIWGRGRVCGGRRKDNKLRNCQKRGQGAWRKSETFKET